MNQLHRRTSAVVCLLLGALLATPLSGQATSPAQSPPATQPAPSSSPQQPSTSPQQPAASPSEQPAPAPAPAPQQPAEPHGQVLYQSHGDEAQPAPPGADTPAASSEKPVAPDATPQLTDTDRAALRITRYDLDIRLTPDTEHLTGRARLTVRNAGDKPLARLALQISSSLIWQSASLDGRPLTVEQHLLDTDADHTGRARELILLLPAPLAPGASLTLSTFYEGIIRPDATRLERLGMPTAQALATDWDAISPDVTALRGFGNVLWFPIAAPQLFLSDATLVPAVARARRDHADVPVRLRLSIEYTSDPPVAAYFCGRRQPLTALHDDPDAPTATGSGIATATFAEEPIGVRPLSLFVIPLPEVMLGAAPASGTASAPGAPSLLAVESSNEPAFPALTHLTEQVAPLLAQWLGPHPLSALTLIDHDGEPFEDGPLLVAPLVPLSAPSSAPLLAHSLTHAWVQTGQPWMDEGLAEFFSLLWIEQSKGRETALAQLDALMKPVRAADTLPALSTPASAPPEPEAAAADTSISSAAASVQAGQPLVDAYDEIYVRRKAAAVWWMLQDIAGESSLQAALSAWRIRPPAREPVADAVPQAEAFEALLEKISGKDLGWFFNDWVMHDRGLPSLSIADVTPRELPAGAGHGAGWLVAVTVHNAGAAGAEVPLIVRAGQLSVTRRILIPGGSNTTERVLLQAPPTEVVVNDGSTPESGPSTHTREIVLHQD